MSYSLKSCGGLDGFYIYDYPGDPGYYYEYPDKCSFGVGAIISWIAWGFWTASIVPAALIVHTERVQGDSLCPGRSEMVPPTAVSSPPPDAASAGPDDDLDP